MNIMKFSFKDIEFSLGAYGIHITTKNGEEVFLEEDKLEQVIAIIKTRNEIRDKD